MAGAGFAVGGPEPADFRVAVEEGGEFGDFEGFAPWEAEVFVWEPEAAGVIAEAFAEFAVAEDHAWFVEEEELSADEVVGESGWAGGEGDVCGAGEEAEAEACFVEDLGECGAAVADGREGEGGADFREEGDGAGEEGDGRCGGGLDGAKAAAAGHGEVEVLAAGEHGLEPCAVVADEGAEGLEAEGFVEWEAVDGGGDHGGVGAVGCGGAEEELEEALEDAAAAVFRGDGEETGFAPVAVRREMAFEVREFEGEGERGGEADGEHADDVVAVFGDEVEV